MCRSAKSRAASVQWDSSSALRCVTAVWSSAAVGSNAAVWSSSVTWASGSRPAGTGTDGWPPRSVIRLPEGMRPESLAGPPCALAGAPGRAGLHRRWAARCRATAFQSCLAVAVRVPESFPGRGLLLRRLAVDDRAGEGCGRPAGGLSRRGSSGRAVQLGCAASLPGAWASGLLAEPRARHLTPAGLAPPDGPHESGHTPPRVQQVVPQRLHEGRREQRLDVACPRVPGERDLLDEERR